MPVQRPQRTFHAVGERRTAAVPAVGSCVLHAEKRFGPLEVADAVARQVPRETILVAVRVATGASELPLEGEPAGIEKLLAATSCIGSRATQRDVADDLKLPAVDHRQRVREVV